MFLFRRLDLCGFDRRSQRRHHRRLARGPASTGDKGENPDSSSFALALTIVGIFEGTATGMSFTRLFPVVGLAVEEEEFDDNIVAGTFFPHDKAPLSLDLTAGGASAPCHLYLRQI